MIPIYQLFESLRVEAARAGGSVHTILGVRANLVLINNLIEPIEPRHYAAYGRLEICASKGNEVL